jgi:hypothetical protein
MVTREKDRLQKLPVSGTDVFLAFAAVDTCPRSGIRLLSHD